MSLCECGCGQECGKGRRFIQYHHLQILNRNHERRARLSRERKGSVGPVRHGHSAGGKVSPTYNSWKAMQQRCLNPNHPQWKNWGGRGIRVCDRWLESFDNFLSDMGERPEGMTLDRIDVNGNYESRNCRWATRIEQAREKRKLSDENVQEIRASGVTARELADRYGVTEGHIYDIRRRRRR